MLVGLSPLRGTLGTCNTLGVHEVAHTRVVQQDLDVVRQDELLDSCFYDVFWIYWHSDLFYDRLLATEAI